MKYKRNSNVSSKTDVPAVTKITSDEFIKQYEKLIALEGRTTSSMNDEELRLVEFFTERDDCQLPADRHIATYIKGLLAMFELDLVKIDPIVEDKEVYFEPYELMSLHVLDDAFYSLEMDTYRPVRSRKGLPFNRVNVYRDKIYTMSGDDFLRLEPEVRLRPEVTKVSEAMYSELPYIYVHEQVGSEFIIGDRKILQDEFRVPGDRQPLPKSIIKYVCEKLVEGSNTLNKSPKWVARGLAKYDETGDPSFIATIEVLGLKLGRYRGRERSYKSKASFDLNSITIESALHWLREEQSKK